MESLNLVGLLRVKNESRWIAEVVDSILPICAHVFVFDDHSTDGTPAIVRAIERTTVIDSPFEGPIDEKRDKDHLLAFARRECDPEWALMIDGDEVLEEAGQAQIVRCVKADLIPAFALQVAYLWDNPHQIRVDGIYADFWRPSLFKVRGSVNRFLTTSNGGNFHCSNVPADRLDEYERCRARLKHYGYMERAQRIAKFRWYNRIDPNNAAEDCYRHMVQGDLPEFPAGVRLKHAGPLALKPWP